MHRSHAVVKALCLILVSVAVIVCGGCASCPECPERVCPDKDMAVILPGLPFVLKMPKGGMDDPNRAIPLDEFEEMVKRQMMRQGNAL